MALITLAEFKTYLQIPTLTTTYDAGYDAFIEPVSSDVENMSNQFFDLTYVVNTSTNSPYLTGSVEQYDIFEGMTVSGTGIPARAIVQDTSLYQITMNKYATADGTGITTTYNAVPEQIKPVIANMVMYKIQNNTSTAGGSVKDIKSKGIGPVSTSFGEGAAIDNTYGYPRNLVKSIKKIKRVSIDIGKLRRRGEDVTNIENRYYHY